MASRQPANDVRVDDRVPPSDAAAAAGLRYALPGGPGLRRQRCGRGFVYRDPSGRAVSNADTIARVRALAIPPAWTDVWIATSPVAHVQATGRDRRMRKQYRYHAQWRAARDETKFARMLAFGRALGRIRARTRRDLRQPGLTRAKVLATIVQLLERTAVRVGNLEYVRQNGSYGLTTMRNRHVKVRGGRIEFDFVGKGGIRHRIHLDDPRLARVVRGCQDLPGQELFQYIDDEGLVQRVTSEAVNEYLHDITAVGFTAKDFRTWTGTVLALRALREAGLQSNDADVTRALGAAIDSVAATLGNTATVCRKSYVHPVVIEAFRTGSLFDSRRRGAAGARGGSGLNADERTLLALIARRHAGSTRSDGRRLPHPALRRPAPGTH